MRGLPDRRGAYDKLTVVVVALNEEVETDNLLLRMLNTLLSPRKSYEEKKAELENEYQINLNGETGEEINKMCNFSGYVREVGRREGKEIGLREGRQEGGISSTINLCKEFGQTRRDTLLRLCRDFSLAEEAADQYLDQYWDVTGQIV